MAGYDSWSTRDSDDRRVSVTVVPDGFYLDVEEGGTHWAAARLTPEAAAALQDVCSAEAKTCRADGEVAKHLRFAEAFLRSWWKRQQEAAS